jgi:hypothetical protein
MKDQYFFLTTRINSSRGVQTHRVGVVAVRILDNNKFDIAATIVSKSDPFIAKKGVMKALSRLNGNDRVYSTHLVKEVDAYDIRALGIKGICRALGLKSDDNWFKHIDWHDADRKFNRTFLTRDHDIISEDVTKFNRV